MELISLVFEGDPPPLDLLLERLDLRLAQQRVSRHLVQARDLDAAVLLAGPQYRRHLGAFKERLSGAKRA